MAKNQKSYTPEFKQQIVDLRNKAGKGITELSNEYGVPKGTISTWVKLFTPIQVSDTETISMKEYKALQKKMKELEIENEILKKSYRHIRQKSIAEYVSFIQANLDNYTVKRMCKVLKFHRSTYYAAINHVTSQREIDYIKFSEEVQFYYDRSKGRYGAIKIQRDLEEAGIPCSVKRVQRHMAKLGLRSVVVRKYKYQNNQGKIPDNKENILNRDFTATTINQKWVTDITYIHVLNEGWTYLASVMDLYNRKIIGYSYGKNPTAELAKKAVENACINVKDTTGIILHSDLGSQYTSRVFEDMITEKNMKHSFSRKGNPYDNACIESFHSVLKKEEVYLNTYLTFEEAETALFEYIESWYNRRRRHSALDYKTPQQVEEEALVA